MGMEKSKLIDVASGTGDIAKLFFEKTNFTAQITCIEPNKEMLDQGIAKECARFVLPLAVPTRIYMTGSVRSWIHYIDLRSANGTQKEHMDIANAVRDVFVKQFPICAEALEWN